jgi:DNA polymerase-4
MALWVLHVDLDEFIAAVEILRRPELKGRPVVVGGDGDPTKRGVVSTANYEARRFGIGSAMPLRTALKRCPDAVFLPVDGEAYRAASDRVMEVLRSFEVTVEVAGWDEAFMAVDVVDEPEALAREVQARVIDRTGLWSSIGVGDNKLRAKLASGFAKPRGVFRLTGDTWRGVMYALPADALWGIGTKTARKLAALGIRTVEDLATADPAVLAGSFGPNTGPWLRRLAEGESSSAVSDVPHVAKSISRERTFQRDLTDPGEIRREVERLAGELADDVATDGRPAVRIVVKVRFVPFITRTHGVGLPRPSADVAAITAGAVAALSRFVLDRPVRLVGVRSEF